jgi:hypothetical protein
MANRALIEKEIKEYCDINNIKDVAGFITQCLLTGFNVQKYGVSPSDNIKRENEEINTTNINREKKSTKIQKSEDNKLEVKKHIIKVKNND